MPATNHGDDMDQGKLIRDARARLRLTQAALAIQAGVGINTIKRAEAGGRIQDETIRSICAVLGMDATAFPRPPGEAAIDPAVSEDQVDGLDDAMREIRRRLAGLVEGWDPSPGTRALIALGLVALACAPFALASSLARLRGPAFGVGPVPGPFEWLDLAALNTLFSGGLLFALMVFIGYGVLGGTFLRSVDDPSRWDRHDDWAVPLACLACFAILLPIQGGWGVLQALAMAFSSGSSEGGRLSWAAGIPLILGQALVAVRLARACGPLLRVPPLVPFGLAWGFLMLSPIQVPMGIGLLATAMVVGCAFALRRPTGRAGTGAVAA